MMLNTTSDTLFGSRIKPAVYFIHEPTIRVRCRDWRANVAGIRLGVTLRIGLTRLKGKIHARWQRIKTQETAWNRWMSRQKFYRTIQEDSKTMCVVRYENMHLVSRIWCFRLVRDTEGPVGLASLESWTKFYTSKGWRLWVDAASWWFQCLWQASDIPDPLPFLQIALYLLLAVVCNAQFVSNAESSKGWSTVILSANNSWPECCCISTMEFILTFSETVTLHQDVHSLFWHRSSCCSPRTFGWCWLLQLLLTFRKVVRGGPCQEASRAGREGTNLGTTTGRATQKQTEPSKHYLVWMQQKPVCMMLYEPTSAPCVIFRLPLLHTFRSVPLPHSGANLTFWPLAEKTLSF